MAIPSNLYLPGMSISVPKNNSAILTFPVYDNDGDLVDISGFSEIKFTLWDRYPTDGGVVQFQKTLTDTDITIGEDDASFSLGISKTESGAIVGRICYFELEMTDGSGNTRTVAAGPLRAENTYTSYVV